MPGGGLEPPRPCDLRILSQYFHRLQGVARNCRKTHNSFHYYDLQGHMLAHIIAQKCMVPRNKVSPEVSPKIVKYLRTFNPLRPIYACVSTECTVARPTGQPAAQVHLHYHAHKSESSLFSFTALSLIVAGAICARETKECRRVNIIPSLNDIGENDSADRGDISGSSWLATTSPRQSIFIFMPTAPAY